MNRKKSQILRKIHGGQACQLLYVAAKLKIAELLPQTALNLSDAISLDESTLTRFLDALVANGQLNHAGDIYSLTEEGKYLLPDHPESLLPLILYKGSPLVWRAQEKLYEGIVTNQSPFKLAHKLDLFTHLEQNPSDQKLFQDAMSYFESSASSALIDKLDLRPFKTVLDIGGGSGAFLQTLTRTHPHLKGHIFELPSVAKLHPTMPYITGDFLTDPLPAADLYILRNILHDWCDDRALTILKNIQQAMEPKAQLIIIETLIDKEKPLGKFADITMFTLTPGGRERTLSEFKVLLTKAALHLTNVIHSTASKSLLQTTKP